ncbi:CidA/LrgA family protein [Fictibacillus sp. Mic-4]|uniref:CidA/LrgA family protein n=1 Tax=Fictibacillus TaxID=1329200 RepID=UPI0004011A67|nr:CidA/LrgA family protein [Fictibacillus gelatini]
MLRTITQFFVLLATLFIGNSIAGFFRLSFPGSIIGMFLLLFLLRTGLVKINWVSTAANLHLKHMAVLFIPAIIGVFFRLDLLEGLGWKLILILAISCLLSLFGVGFAAEFYEKLTKGRRK